LPNAPSGLTASAVSSSWIYLAWNDNDTTETGFKIERNSGTGGGAYTLIGTVSANTTTYGDTGLAASTTYNYRVRACNGAGDSANSSEVSAITSASSVAAGQNGVNQRFTDNGNGTVTDNQTGLIWLKNANCTDTVGGITPSSGLIWDDAIAWSVAMASGKCGLTDSSTAGQWRLPSKTQLGSLTDPNLGDPWEFLNSRAFLDFQTFNYWTSTVESSARIEAWAINLGTAIVVEKKFQCFVWPVRGGQ
jgi:hypothetical protein